MRVSDGGTPSVAGVCVARENIAGQPVFILFMVFDQSPSDLILALDIFQHMTLLTGEEVYATLSCRVLTER